ncbi:hypothetical protein D3C78_942250 [compost metagenome]
MHLLGHFGGTAGQVAKQPVDFSSGIGGALGQRPDLVGNYRKPTALFAGAGGFDRSIERQQVGLFGNRANGTEDRLNGIAVALQLLNRLRRLLDLLAQPVDTADGRIDLLLAFAGLLLAAVGRLRGLAAGAGNLVGGGDHFVECGGHHVHRFALAPGGLGHVA